MTTPVTCCICQRLAAKEDGYRCLHCGRFFCTDCMIDSTPLCPDCQDP